MLFASYMSECVHLFKKFILTVIQWESVDNRLITGQPIQMCDNFIFRVSNEEKLS